MQTNTLAGLFFLTLTSVALITVVQTLPPSPLSLNAPAEEFSAERASEHIRAIAPRPRPTGSEANALARLYILSVMKDLGAETDTQREGSLQNVIARIAGTKSSGAVLLTAHLDSVAQAPGATDDGSGVAVLLETARALVANGRLRNTVMFLFTDDEEGGSLGAKAFVAGHPWARDVRVVIGLDAGGLGGPGVLSATSGRNGWLISQLTQADPFLVGSSAINAFGQSSTDFGHVFKPAGFSGYAFDLYWDGRTHTPEDNIENVSLSSLQHQGDHALSLARHFSNLDQLADPKEPDAIYFTVLRLSTITYSTTWAVPIGITVAVLLGVVLALGLRWKILTWAGMGYGAFVASGSLLLAPLPNMLLRTWMSGMAIQLASRSLIQPIEVGAVVFIALALIILWYFLSVRIRSTNLPDLSMGALLPLGVGLVGTSIAFPSIGFALAWPLLIGLPACVNWFYWNRRGEYSRTVILALLLCGSLQIIILVPTILLGLFDQPSLTLLLLGALSGFLVPQIHIMLGRPIQDPGQVQ